MDTSKPMSWNDFEAFPDDLKRTYIAQCIDRFGCTMSDFGTLFGVCPSTISRRFTSLGISKTAFKAGRRMTSEQKEQFQAWLDAAPKSEEGEPAVRDDPPSARQSQPPAVGMEFAHLEMIFRGQVDYMKLLTEINRFAGDDIVQIKIVLDREERDQNE